MVFLCVVPAPADAVLANDLGAAMAKGGGPIATMVLVLPSFGTPSCIPVATGP